MTTESCKNPMEINAAELAASWEADLMFATRILGWSMAENGLLVFPDGIPRPPQLVDSFTRNESAVFKVIDHFRFQWQGLHGKDDDEPWVWQLTADSDPAAGWWARIVWCHHDGPIDIVECQAPTFALAICRAALAVWQEYEGRHEGQGPPPNPQGEQTTPGLLPF